MTNQPLEWDAEAERRLKQAPFFVRRIARQKVERAAREQGLSRVTLALVESIKQRDMGR